jgi:hypothetical protein
MRSAGLAMGVAGAPGQILSEFSCSENNVDWDHLSPGPIRPDGSHGYDDLAPLPPLRAVLAVQHPFPARGRLRQNVISV